MKIIPLSQGKVTLVDDIDYDWAMQWKWTAQRAPAKSGNLWYAVRCAPWRNGHRRGVKLHREIAVRAGLPKARQFDHADRDGLNNQRANIRPCSHAQNRANARKTPGLSSKFKGVSWDANARKWRAGMKALGKSFNLGGYATEEQAHRAYERAARKHFGEFAHS